MVVAEVSLDLDGFTGSTDDETSLWALDDLEFLIVPSTSAAASATFPALAPVLATARSAPVLHATGSSAFSFAPGLHFLTEVLAPLLHLLGKGFTVPVSILVGELLIKPRKRWAIFELLTDLSSEVLEEVFWLLGWLFVTSGRGTSRTLVNRLGVWSISDLIRIVSGMLGTLGTGVLGLSCGLCSFGVPVVRRWAVWVMTPVVRWRSIRWVMRRSVLPPVMRWAVVWATMVWSLGVLLGLSSRLSSWLRAE